MQARNAFKALDRINSKHDIDGLESYRLILQKSLIAYYSQCSYLYYVVDLTICFLNTLFDLCVRKAYQINLGVDYNKTNIDLRTIVKLKNLLTFGLYIFGIFFKCKYLFQMQIFFCKCMWHVFAENECDSKYFLQMHVIDTLQQIKCFYRKMHVTQNTFLPMHMMVHKLIRLHDL